jgi:hypothetical protein
MQQGDLLIWGVICQAIEMMIYCETIKEREGKMPDHFKFWIEFFKDYFPMPFILIILINIALWQFHKAWHLPPVMAHLIGYIVFNIVLFTVLQLWDNYVNKKRKKEKGYCASDIFPGIWRNTYKHESEKAYQTFRIVFKNQYHIFNEINKKWDFGFIIDDVEIDGNKIMFSKFETDLLNEKISTKLFDYNELQRESKNIITGFR